MVLGFLEGVTSMGSILRVAGPDWVVVGRDEVNRSLLGPIQLQFLDVHLVLTDYYVQLSLKQNTFVHLNRTTQDKGS